MREDYVSMRLNKYFLGLMFGGKLWFLPNGVDCITISNVRRLGGSNEVYSFLLTYRGKGYQQSANLILKIYLKSIEPVLKNYATSRDFSSLRYSYPQLYCGKPQRCTKEFQVLRGLEHAGFLAPKTLLYELDSTVFGSPFIIMEKEELIQKSTDYMDIACKNLANLHNLDVNALGVTCLKNSEDSLIFARRCILFFKFLLKLSIRHEKQLSRDFDYAIRWLESNINNVRPPNYCLIHGDYHIYANAILTKGSKILVMDWEDAEIGDPAFDVGYAFVRMWVDFDQRTAERFAEEYIRNSSRDIVERLHFYKLVVFLEEAILHSMVLSNPLTTYDIHGITAFLTFPFLRLPFNAKRTRAETDIIWVECFKDFVENQIKR